MTPWIAMSGKTYLGRVLGRDEANAMENARSCWPGRKELTVTPVTKGETRAPAHSVTPRRRRRGA